MRGLPPGYILTSFSLCSGDLCSPWEEVGGASRVALEVNIVALRVVSRRVSGLLKDHLR